MRWPGPEAVAAAVEPQHDVDRLAGRERRDGLVAVAVGEVEQAARHEQRLAAGRDVADARGDERVGLIGRDAQPQLGEAERLDASLSGGVSKQSESASSWRWSSGWLGPP